MMKKPNFRLAEGRINNNNRPIFMLPTNEDEMNKNNNNIKQEETDTTSSTLSSIKSFSTPEIPDRSTSPNPDNNKLGGFKPGDKLPGRGDKVLVGDPQIKVQKEISVSNILKELAAIQAQGPRKYCVLGTRHCSYLHQQIIELLAYALVLSGNHVYTSGAGGTHAATIRGALRAERPDLFTVVLPQSLSKQPKESQELLKGVTDLITMPQNDHLSLDVASRICNSYLLSQADHLISFAFHESGTVREAAREAKELEMLVTILYLD
eukprot:CAMPEP_0178959916 /NCGR_PEP_ID=MMETSP0789-20121207/12607_1 /TAXON_ID=3005 /ORGANISM="Rhizosolenia setigera, Strain CCMP 1694" /LENGTH=264 /DNA_ID=CAMNT_0020643073 /DNA_START=308 /DNA_END=1102 /DNA_ORIENTATION=-